MQPAEHPEGFSLPHPSPQGSSGSQGPLWQPGDWPPHPSCRAPSGHLTGERGAFLLGLPPCPWLAVQGQAWVTLLLELGFQGPVKAGLGAPVALLDWKLGRGWRAAPLADLTSHPVIPVSSSLLRTRGLSTISFPLVSHIFLFSFLFSPLTSLAMLAPLFRSLLFLFLSIPVHSSQCTHICFSPVS